MLGMGVSRARLAQRKRELGVQQLAGEAADRIGPEQLASHLH